MTDDRDYPTPKPRARVPPTIAEQEARARRDTDRAPKPSESQELHAVSLDLESARDVLANAADELRHSAQGRVMVEILRRQLDTAQLLVTLIGRVARMESALQRHQEDADRVFEGVLDRLGALERKLHNGHAPSEGP